MFGITRDRFRSSGDILEFSMAQFQGTVPVFL